MTSQSLHESTLVNEVSTQLPICSHFPCGMLSILLRAVWCRAVWFGMHISIHKNSEIWCQISEQLKAVMHNLELHNWTLQWEISQAVSIQNSHLDYNIRIQVTGSNDWISFRQQSQYLLEVHTDSILELHQQKTILGAPVSLMKCCNKRHGCVHQTTLPLNHNVIILLLAGQPSQEGWQ